MKKMCCIILMILILASTPVYAELSVSAKSCMLMEAVTGKVLYEKNADAVLPMASTTKLFTALMIRECCALDELVTVSASAVQTEGSSAYLKAGERLTVEQLLYAVLLSSGNDAAEVLAEHAFDGNRERFVNHMNQQAKELGLTHTHFTNPSGLPNEEHYTTARELAQIGRLASMDPVISRIAATKNISFSTENDVIHSYTNHNALLRMYPYATGLKTGYTRAAGRCLVSSAEKDGVKLICVTLNAADDWNDHMRLFEYGFTQVRMTCRYNPHDVEVAVKIMGGVRDEIVASNAVPILLPDIEGNEDYRFQYAIEPAIFAPIDEGQTVGKGFVLLNERIISCFDLVAESSLESDRVSDRSFLKEIQRIFNFLLL